MQTAFCRTQFLRIRFVCDDAQHISLHLPQSSQNLCTLVAGIILTEPYGDIFNLHNCTLRSVVVRKSLS